MDSFGRNSLPGLAADVQGLQCAGPTPSRPGLTGARLLLVEDEPLVGMMAQTVLVEHGAEVDWAQTDRDAYRIIGARVAMLHALITDINLREGTTGFDISRFARRLSPSLPVIYVSGEERGSRAEFAVEGATFLYKPVAEAALLKAVGAAISVSRPDSPGPRSRCCS